MGSERLGAGQHRARAKGREGLGTADQGAGPRAGQAGRTQAGCRAQGAGARHKGQGRVARFLFCGLQGPKTSKIKILQLWAKAKGQSRVARFHFEVFKA